jgi:hypothetical protein
LEPGSDLGRDVLRGEIDPSERPDNAGDDEKAEKEYEETP